MNRELVVYNLSFTLRAKEQIAFDRYAGSALRGALMEALEQRCHTPGEAWSCPPCALGTLCPIASLIAPTQETATRGHDLPRPLVLRPPLADDPVKHGDTRPLTPALVFEPGQCFRIGYVLIGNASRYFSTLVLATRAMEHIGAGRPLHTNKGRRGRFVIEGIEAVNPFTQRRAVLYGSGQLQIGPLVGAITEEDVIRRATRLSDRQITLQFLTPTRLTNDGKLVHVPDPGILLQRLAERLDALTQAYGMPSTDIEETRRKDRSSDDQEGWYAIAKTSQTHLADCQVTWVDTKSYSSRQQRSLPIGGFVGKATVQGSLSHRLRQLLAWGELLHVGKNVMKGDGWYQILSESVA